MCRSDAIVLKCVICTQDRVLIYSTYYKNCRGCLVKTIPYTDKLSLIAQIFFTPILCHLFYIIKVNFFLKSEIVYTSYTVLFFGPRTWAPRVKKYKKIIYWHRRVLLLNRVEGSHLLCIFSQKINSFAQK